MNDFAPLLSRKLPSGQLSLGSKTRKEVASLTRRTVTLVTSVACKVQRIASYTVTGNERILYSVQ